MGEIGDGAGETEMVGKREIVCSRWPIRLSKRSQPANSSQTAHSRDLTTIRLLRGVPLALQRRRRFPLPFLCEAVDARESLVPRRPAA